MKPYYVVVSSWEDILWRVVAWSGNPYVAISYFKEYRLMDKDSKMLIIECDNTMELSKIVRSEYATELEDFTDNILLTKTSQDGRCYVIYKRLYKDLFSDDYLSSEVNSTHISDIMSKIMLSMAPLVRYISDVDGYGVADAVNSLIFNGFTHTSIKRLLRQSTSISDQVLGTIDIVYFWKYILSTKHSYIVGAGRRSATIPVDAVFIDSN